MTEVITSPPGAQHRRYSNTTVAMDTIVTATVVSDDPSKTVAVKVERALRWFDEVERACSRFDPNSEVSRLARQPGEPVAVTEILFQTVALACEVAQTSAGAFDPTIGATLARRGFDRDWRTGHHVPTPIPLGGSWRDVQLDPHAHTITLKLPLLLDLGAVAKGLAIDLALGELIDHAGAMVEAGGDLRVSGVNEHGQSWRVGVRDPSGTLGQILTPGDAAVCTSGGYARRSGHDEHHLLDPRTATTADATLSATVIAPTAAAADALSTAAFVLGGDRAIELLERERVEGFLVTSHGVRTTRARA